MQITLCYATLQPKKVFALDGINEVGWYSHIEAYFDLHIMQNS